MATVTVLPPFGTAHSGCDDDVPVLGPGFTPPGGIVDVVVVDGDTVVGGPGSVGVTGMVVLVLVVVVSGGATSALMAGLRGPASGAAVPDAFICAPLSGRAM